MGLKSFIHNANIIHQAELFYQELPNFTSGQALSALFVFLFVILASLHMKRLFGSPYWFSALCVVSLNSFMDFSTRTEHHAVANPMFLASFCFLTWPGNSEGKRAAFLMETVFQRFVPVGGGQRENPFLCAVSGLYRIFIF